MNFARMQKNPSGRHLHLEAGKPMNKVNPGISSESECTWMTLNIDNTQMTIGPNSEINDRVSAIADNDSFFAASRSFRAFCSSPAGGTYGD